MGKQQRTQGAHVAQGGVGDVGAGGDGHGDLAHAAGQLVEAAAEEVGHAAAEDGQRKTGDVLVGPEGDGEEGVNQPAEGGKQEAAYEAEDQTHHGGGAAVQFVEERGDQTADGA